MLKDLKNAQEKGRQVMDVAWTQAQVVERSLDDHSKGACTQADMKQFYCHLAPVLVARWLLARGCSPNTCYSFLRLQLCPSISINVANSMFKLPHRNSGVFTGCLSAA